MQFITCEQNKILKDFTCERLKSNQKNQILIQTFVNSRNEHLQEKLKQKGWEEDVSGDVAYYVIKRDDKIALYFTIKTGLLFNKEQTSNDLLQDIKDNKTNLTNTKREFFKYKLAGTLTLKTIKDFKNKFLQLQGKLRRSKISNINFEEDQKNEPNKKLNYVHTTYPGIELHIFCANEDYKDDWETLNFPDSNNRMGIIFFWKFIVPKVFEAQNIIGCKYLYLFAADSTEDQTLISYYNTLKFTQDITISTSKPSYDWSCFFMSQEINALYNERDKFFRNFNPDPTIPKV